jgi:recombination protein RecR
MVCGFERVGMASVIDTLIEEFNKLPGIGKKTAQRLTYHLLKASSEEAIALSDAIREIKEKISFCSRCSNLTEIDPCAICGDAKRDHRYLCVIEEPSDIGPIERTGSYRGLYHVLMGVISPLDGVGPDDLTIDRLLDRLKSGSFQEVIVATNPTREGEVTASYLAKVLKPSGIRVTRIARGLPVGGDIEYADEVTLSEAMDGRRELD